MKQQQQKQDQPALGQQPESGDELDARQRQANVADGRRAKADDAGGKDGAYKDGERLQRARTSRDDNDAGQNRLNE